MYWTLQNLKDMKTSSKCCTLAQSLAPLQYCHIVLKVVARVWQRLLKATDPA
jgi:hypothetical protein